MKEVLFDPNGSLLWLQIDMGGVYLTTYSYQLWSATATEKPVLTHPLRQGNNITPHDDNYQIVNDDVPNEPIAKFNKRTVDVRFTIKVINGNDNGYSLIASILQGPNLENAQLLGSASVDGSVGSVGIKQEFVTIQLKAKP